MNSSHFRARLHYYWPLLALLLIAAVRFYRSPYSASNLEVVPDSVEYALAPLQLLETGRYEIIVEGRGLPPRYPPWFCVLVVSPAYLLFGHDPGNAILPVTLLAVASVGFAYAIGKRTSGPVGGALAALAVLILPSFNVWAIQIMTDVPCAALMLGTCLLYLHLPDTPESSRVYLGAGVLVAVTTLFRPVFAAMLLPFLFTILKQRRNPLARTALLLAPMAAAAAASLAYNTATFGDPLRNGYNLWVALPYDYPRMMFSLSFVGDNLRELAPREFPIIVLIGLVAWLLGRATSPAVAVSETPLTEVTGFFGATTVPITLFHLVYFYPHGRFFIPILTGAAVLAALMVGRLIASKGDRLLKIVLPVVFLLVLAARIAAPPPIPLRRFAADQVRKNTPDNAVVISAIDPVYLTRLAAAGSSRHIVPLSRKVEYASKLLVWKRIEDPRLSSLSSEQEVDVALIWPHAEEVVRFVASEQMEELAQQAAGGTPVFLESLFTDPSEAAVLDKMKARFHLVERAPYLFQLLPR